MILYLIGTQDSNKETTVRGLKENLVEALDRKEGDPNRTSWTNELYFRSSYNKFKEQEVFHQNHLTKVLEKKTELLESLVRLNSSLTEKASHFDDVSFTLPTLGQSRQIFLPVY